MFVAQNVLEVNFMRRIKAKYILAGLIVSGALLIALSGQVGYPASWIAFGGIAVAAGLFAIVQSGLRLNDWFQVKKEKGPNYDIMGIHGLHPASQPALALKEGIRRALVQGETKDKPPIACACVREEDDGFVGIVRMGQPGSHACHEVTGPTQEDAAQKLTRWLSEHEKDWVRSKDGTSETNVCNHHVCPLTSPAHAFAETTSVRS